MATPTTPTPNPFSPADREQISDVLFGIREEIAEVSDRLGRLAGLVMNRAASEQMTRLVTTLDETNATVRRVVGMVHDGRSRAEPAPEPTGEHNGDKPANTCTPRLTGPVIIEHWEDASFAGRYYSPGIDPRRPALSMDVTTGGGDDSRSKLVEVRSFAEIPPSVFGLACDADRRLLVYSAQLKPEEPAVC